MSYAETGKNHHSKQALYHGQEIDNVLEKVTFVTHYMRYWITKGTFMPTPTTPPSAVRRTLRKLGQDIADALVRALLSLEGLLHIIAGHGAELDQDLAQTEAAAAAPDTET